jgi:hemerythrin superfamily protein
MRKSSSQTKKSSTNKKQSAGSRAARRSTKSARSGQSRSGESSSEQESVDAIELLKQQHREVEELLARFDEASSADEAHELAGSICDKLKVHSTIEEEIFYPAARKEKDENEQVLQALEEHLSVKRLISDLEGLDSEDERLRPKVSVLKDQVSHHVDEEEHEMFPKVSKTMNKSEREALGRQLQDRAGELQAADGGGAQGSDGGWPHAADMPRRQRGAARRSH